MGLQPIDLQVMYQQSNNVAKMAGSQQAAQLSQSMAQTKAAQDNIENAQKVQQASNDKSNSQSVTDRGGGNGSPYGGSSAQHKDDSSDEGTSKKYGNLKESYLGTIIDISR